MQKKRTIVWGWNAEELALLSQIIANDHPIVIADTLETAMHESKNQMKSFASAFHGLADIAKPATETFMIYNDILPEWPQSNIDPSLAFPKSFQNPKGEKTGTKTCGMSAAKRQQLKKKRKKKKKR